MKNKFVFLTILFALSGWSQNNFWKTESIHIDKSFYPKNRIPDQYISINVDYQSVISLLQQAPELYNTKLDPVLVSFPDENGNPVVYKIFQSGTLSEGLRQQYPDIRTYRGFDIQNRQNIISITTGITGLQVGVLRTQKPDLIIQPIDGTRNHYMIYTKNHLKPSPFECLTQDTKLIELPVKNRQVSDGILRKYRFAVGTTGEYSQFHINRAIQAGTLSNTASDAEKKAAVLQAVTTTIDRVNSVYERDFSVLLELVNNETDVIFLNPATDPYDNSDIMSMLYANTNVLNNHLGSANYDGGHLFTTYAGGGISRLGAICQAPYKAASITGSTNPIGDSYDIDYVAHEIGHAFGCNHTFANSCGNNRNINTSVEPGSGSTIMAYAGVCYPNVQNHSDAYFSVISINECLNFITQQATCSQNIQTGNHAPVINTTHYGAVHLPKSTPFMLKATATDADHDNLTYCWEEIDPVTNNVVTYRPNPNYDNGPAFRSLEPTNSGVRYFPKISAVINHTYQTTWEALPAVNRNMNFAVTVRDNHAGGGQTPQELISFQIDETSGPFRITSQTQNEIWIIDQTVNITWDVANTQNAPVNCQSVDFYLSNDNGESFAYLIATDVPNTGHAEITVPAIATPGTDISNALLMIKAHDNYFFDLAEGRISLQGATEKTGLQYTTIFPIPSEDFFEIQFTPAYPEQDTTIYLYNINGQMIFEKTYAPTVFFNERIKTGKFATGVYFVKITNGDERLIKPVIIK